MDSTMPRMQKLINKLREFDIKHISRSFNDVRGYVEKFHVTNAALIDYWSKLDLGWHKLVVKRNAKRPYTSIYLPMYTITPLLYNRIWVQLLKIQDNELAQYLSYEPKVLKFLDKISNTTHDQSIQEEITHLRSLIDQSSNP